MDAESSWMATAPVRKKRNVQIMDNAAAGPPTSSAEEPNIRKTHRYLNLLKTYLNTYFSRFK